MDNGLLYYVVDQALILVPVLYIIGAILKGTPRIANWTIPWVLLVLGILGTSVMLGFGLDSVLQGILVSGASVFVNQLYQQSRRRGM